MHALCNTAANLYLGLYFTPSKLASTEAIRSVQIDNFFQFRNWTALLLGSGTAAVQFWNQPADPFENWTCTLGLIVRVYD